LTYLLEKNNLPRVSVERVASGTGIASIYQFFRDTNPLEETAAMTEIFQAWSREIGRKDKTVDLAAEVYKAALAGGDFLCEQTMNLFISAYGAEAGDLALQILPFGGLYVAGGIAPKILPMLQQGAFMKAFSVKGRMRPLLEKIPVYVILDPKVGLIGAVLTAKEIEYKASAACRIRGYNRKYPVCRHSAEFRKNRKEKRNGKS
jgi:glucokinase